MTDRLDRWADPPLLVLASLADEPKHGYAITRDVAETMGVRLSGSLDLSFIAPSRPEFMSGPIFFESARGARDASDSARRTLEQLDLNYFIPCRIREHTVAVLGLGKTVDGDYLSSDDVELVQTIAGYVAIALDNSVER